MTNELKKIKKSISIHVAPPKGIEPPSKMARLDTVCVGQISNEDGVDHVWLKFRGCCLTESDRMIFVSNDLLNDDHINYAHTLLYHHFQTASGVQNTLLQTESRKKKIDGTDVLIVHDGGNHWIFVSTFNYSCSSIKVYNSFYSAVIDGTFKGLNDLFEFSNNTEVQQVKVQRHIEIKDYGVFPIAISAAVLHGIGMTCMSCCQKEMRQHLISCFCAKSLTPFPSI